MPSPAPKYFKAWIIFFLIATVGGAILGMIIGACLGLGMKLAGAELDQIKFVARIVGFVVAVPISYFTFRYVVQEFIVADLTTPPPVPPTLPTEPPRL